MKGWTLGNLIAVPDPIMKATWYAVVYERKAKTCFDTLGHFDPWRDDDGNLLDDFWETRLTDFGDQPTLRQLHPRDFETPDKFDAFVWMDNAVDGVAL